MSLDPLLMLYAVAFGAALLLVEGVYYLSRDWNKGQRQAVNRRMALIAGDRDQTEVLRVLRRERHGPVSRALAMAAPFLERIVAEAGMTASLGRVCAGMAALWGIVYLGLWLLAAVSYPIAFGVAGIVGVGVPLLVIVRKRAKRLGRCGEQLPDALELIVRCLRAGHPVSAALATVAKETPDPLGTEFGILVDEMTYGLNLDMALRNVAARMPHPDLHFLVVCMQIQHMVGGNLAEVLTNLASVVRDRFQMFAKIRATSAEGRLSGVIIGLLPFIVAGALSVLNPGYYGDVRDDALFGPLVGFALLLLFAGQFTIWRMVNFRV